MLNREQHEELWELFRTYGRAKRQEGREPSNAQAYADADAAGDRFTTLLVELTDPAALNELIAASQAERERQVQT